MNRRNKILIASSLAVSTGAIVTGAMISSGAMASSPVPNNASLEVVSVSGPEGDAFVCHFDDVDLPLAGTAGTSGALQVVGNNIGDPTSGGTTMTGSGVITSSADSGLPPTDGVTVVSSEAVLVPGDAPIVATGDAVDAPDGDAVVLGNAPFDIGSAIARTVGDNVREGTAEECAALRPEALTTP